MSPRMSEKLLQDTNSYRKSRPRSTSVLIGVLIILVGLAVLMGIRLRSAGDRYTPPVPSQLIPTPLPLTGTFLDRIHGSVVYLREGRLYEYVFARRHEQQILLTDGSQTVETFAARAPVWSLDGKTLVTLRADRTLQVSEFDTGTFIAAFPLLEKTQVEGTAFSLDPFGRILHISEPESGSAGHTTRFFSLQTQKPLGVYHNCADSGVWLRALGFVTTCTTAEDRTVVLIQFDSSTSSMIPLTRVNGAASYQLLKQYRADSVLALRLTGSKRELVAISVRGTVQVIPEKEYVAVGGIDQVVDPTGQLRRRIERELRLTGVKDVSVASSNEWLVFETEQGLFAAPMTLAESPYMLGPGTTPRVRPY